MNTESTKLGANYIQTTENIFLRVGMVLLVVCVVLPFVGQAFPYGLPVFGPVVFATFCVVMVSRLRVSGPIAIKLSIGVFGMLLLLVIATCLYGVLRTSDMGGFGSYVAQDLANGFEVLLLCITAVNIPWNTQRLEKFGSRVISLLFVVSIALAILGLYKYALLQKGIQIQFIMNGIPDRRYPWGSSLVQDYDYYALALLCGMLAAISGMIVKPKWRNKLIYLVGFCIMGAAGFLSGSRRFWVLAPVLIIFELFWILKKKGGSGYAFKWLLFLFIAVAACLAYVLPGSDVIQGMSAGGLDIKLRLQSLITSHGDYGLGERLALFNYGISSLDVRTVLLGGGFDYLRDFGCHFQSCNVANYPHNPVLSAFLYGGIVSAIVAIAFLIHIFILIIKSLSGRPNYIFFGLSLLAGFVFIVVSGDTVLSAKSLLVTAMVCMLYEKCRIRSKAEKYAHSAHCH